MSTALFIGRFQPFHLGHLSVVKTILQNHDFLIIGIGSAEESRTSQNPFTASERWSMISSTLDAEKIPRKKYTLIPIRDINNPGHWVKHVENLVPPFDCIYTGSPLVKKLFKKHKKYKIIPVKILKGITATQVRNALEKNKKWQSFLPPAVAKFLQKNVKNV
ncbi:MAG: nicotinamide-nucleotide adenylyltransferase [Candidatus Gracilibacteria bacterium]|jgi:nicotinamide-nucleotide adenylyltransferase